MEKLAELVELVELVDQKTNGDFNLKISYGGLSKSKENLDGISIGAFEMAQFCSFYHQDKKPRPSRSPSCPLPRRSPWPAFLTSDLLQGRKAHSTSAKFY